MADEKAKGGNATKKGKRTKMKKGTYYKVEGGKLVRKKTCPKCGAGVFMAQHSNRVHCGKCSYTEFR